MIFTVVMEFSFNKRELFCFQGENFTDHFLIESASSPLFYIHSSWMPFHCIFASQHSSKTNPTSLIFRTCSVIMMTYCLILSFYFLSKMFEQYLNSSSMINDLTNFSISHFPKSQKRFAAISRKLYLVFHNRLLSPNESLRGSEGKKEETHLLM